jgi:hypothetical protein
MTVIPVGGSAGSSPATVVFQAFVTDPDPGDSIQLELEVQNVNTAFSDARNENPGTLVPRNSTATVTAQRSSGLLGATASYFWHVRACDQTNRCTSTWVSFGGNSDVVGLLNSADTDFHVP